MFMGQITTHVLDTALGLPAAGIELLLSVLRHGEWLELTAATTNDDGRAPDLLEGLAPLESGTYCMRFATGPYLQRTGGQAFYPWVEVVFQFDAAAGHFHIPLLLSPFGYSTYRGS